MPPTDKTSVTAPAAGANPADSVTWLTQDAHDRLAKELDELIANRPAMAKEINDRREEGDLKENGGYHAAREEQGKQEARIAHLSVLLRSAQVGAAPASDGIAGPGMVVTVRFGGDTDTETFLIRVPRRGRDREHRRLLGSVAARPGLDRGSRRRDRRVPDPQRQDAAGDPGQGGALHRLSRLEGR